MYSSPLPRPNPNGWEGAASGAPRVGGLCEEVVHNGYTSTFPVSVHLPQPNLRVVETYCDGRTWTFVRHQRGFVCGQHGSNLKGANGQGLRDYPSAERARL